MFLAAFKPLLPWTLTTAKIYVMADLSTSFKHPQSVLSLPPPAFLLYHFKLGVFRNSRARSESYGNTVGNDHRPSWHLVDRAELDISSDPTYNALSIITG
jgi:hypothetical protein